MPNLEVRETRTLADLAINSSACGAINSVPDVIVYRPRGKSISPPPDLQPRTPNLLTSLLSWVPQPSPRSLVQGDRGPKKLPSLHPHPQPSVKQFLMSSRTTRSSARLATDPPPDADSGSASTHAAGSAPSRKRKAPGRRDRQTDIQNQPPAPSSPRRSKRQKTTASHSAAPSGPAAPVPRRSAATRGRTAMSQPG